MTNSEMYKNLASKIWLIIVLCSISTPLFANVSFYDLLEKEVGNISPISKIIDWKPMVKNLFEKNLDLVKNNELSSTDNAIDNIVDYFRQNNCFVTKKDVMNVVFNSNYQAQYKLEQVIISKWNIKIDKKNDSDITQSYKRFLDCQNPKNESPSFKDTKDLENQVNNLYNKLVKNEYEMITKNQDNFWEDLFRNWDIEDSSFDILKDIYNIWSVLMQDFDKNPQIYFYDIPDKDSESRFSMNNIIWNKLASINDTDTQVENYSLNADINKFILDTNQSNITDQNSVDWQNQCIDNTSTQWQSKDSDTVEEEIANNIKYQEFISGINNFIATANTDKNTNNLLSDKSKEEIENINNSTSEPDDYSTKVEKFVDKNMTIDSCSTNCWGKTDLWEKEKCELDCSLSCFQKCDKLSDKYWKTLCKAECICFLISLPEKPIVNNLIDQDIFKIRFCKVPVMNQKIEKNKTVSSVEDIFSEMLNVIRNLRDWWQMIKHKQTKEFFEIPVEINFWKIFSFWLNINQKKIPNSKATKTLESERKETDKKLKAAALNTKESNNEKDDYNKYIIIQPIELEKADTEDVSTISQYLSRLLENKKSDTSEDKQIMTQLQNSKNISSTIQIETFLWQNIQFREEFTNIMSDSNDMAYSLKEKIKSSK